jgi:peptide-methionine (S)-S-oxide reductase
MTNETHETATLAGGCFWCLEGVFEQVRGVSRAVSGYANGSVADPTYEQVCTGRTGHAEVVQLTFDPTVIRFADLLDIFFAIHDPTTLNRQGADVGTQYRSGIYVQSPQQAATARAKLAEVAAANAWGAPLVTEIEPLRVFYPAEDYHQGYFRAHPAQAYCAGVVGPKVAKFRKAFAQWLKPAD